MLIKIFLKIFFLIPAWVLRCITLQKSLCINNQILDFQTQIFLSLQSMQNNAFENLDSIQASDLRVLVEGGREGLPLNAKSSQNVKVLDHYLLTEFGKLQLREYCPDQVSVKSSILYFHGGGYVLGSIKTHDPWLQFFASEIGVRIFSLDYRLAPENKFPCSLTDANLSLNWLVEELKIPCQEISLCGDSAGAHLAASLSTFRAINNLELPASQCLIYPMTDPSCSSKSHTDYAEGFFLTKKAMVWFWDQLKNSDLDLVDPMFNLTITPNAKLPKTLLITAGFDPLSDEGESYARLLHESGNQVEQIHYPHMIHGFVNMTSLRAAKVATKDLLASYRKEFLNI
jgi:acetyl esterase